MSVQEEDKEENIHHVDEEIIVLEKIDQKQDKELKL